MIQVYYQRDFMNIYMTLKVFRNGGFAQNGHVADAHLTPTKIQIWFFLAKSIPLNYIHDGISLLLFKSIHLLRICYVKADSCAVCVDARRYHVICAHLRVVFLVLWHRKWRVSARINAIWSAQMRYLRDTEKRSSHVNVTKSSIYQSINHKSHYKVLIIFSVELTIKKITRKWS